MVTLEEIKNKAWKVRIGPVNNEMGDDYTTVCTIELLDDNETLYISAMAGPGITNRMIRELLVKCARLGYSELVWERMEDGVLIKHEYVFKK